MLCENGCVIIHRNNLPDYYDIRFKLMNINGYTSSKKYMGKTLNIFREVDNYLILPRWYGFSKIQQYNMQLVDKMSIGKPFTKDYTSTILLRDYQRDAIDNLMNVKYGGILKLPTGAGKTIVSIDLIVKKKLKTMIILKTKAMVEQWKDDIEKFVTPKPSICILSSYRKREDGLKSFNESDIILCVRNTLTSNKYSYKDFVDIGIVIIDEIHSYMSSKLINIFYKISRRYILGVTATIKLHSDLEFLINYYVGPIIFDYNYSYKGVDPEIYMINYYESDKKYNKLIMHDIGFEKKEINYTNTYMNMLFSPNRNNVVVDIINECIKDENTKRIIVIAQYRKVLKLLYKKLGDNISGLYYSVTKKEDIEAMKKTIETKKVILAVSALGNESLNIIDCNCLILVSPPIIKMGSDGEWNTLNMKQVIGRCLRQNWNIAPKIYVINDMFSFFIRHMRLRNLYFTQLHNYKVEIRKIK